MLFLTKENKFLIYVCLRLTRKFSNFKANLQDSFKIESETKKNIFDRQWEVVEEVTDDSKWFKFSLASYNVLSQNLLDNNKRLYKMCQSRFLTWQHRKEVLKKELSYYQPDVLCLQEVHFQEFSKFFVPELQKLGYFGLYKKRTSAKEDGCATFFRHEKFCLEAFRYLEYHHKDVPALNHDNVALLLLLKPNLHPRESDPRPGNPHVDPTLHSTALPPIDQAKKEQLKDLTLCVANTHLLFNPLRGEVKLAQLMTLLAAIDDLKAEHKCTTIICGDFNSTPYSGLYKFVLNGRVECKDVDLKFFSGQIKPTPEDLQEANLRKPLSPLFLQKLSLTDQCQFVEVLKKRYEKNAEGTSTQSTKNFFMDEEDETALPPFSYTQGSGVITHDFDFETVFDHSNYNDNQPHVKEVSFFLETNCSKVDYIFYSQTANQKRRRKAQKDTTSTEPEPSPSSPNELTLLRKLKLWTEAEIRNKYTSGMPNSGLGSDHLIMLAEFGVKLS